MICEFMRYFRDFATPHLRSISCWDEFVRHLRDCCARVSFARFGWYGRLSPASEFAPRERDAQPETVKRCRLVRARTVTKLVQTRDSVAARPNRAAGACRP
jgi:hypothetical protein